MFLELLKYFTLILISPPRSAYVNRDILSGDIRPVQSCRMRGNSGLTNTWCPAHHRAQLTKIKHKHSYQTSQLQARDLSRTYHADVDEGPRLEKSGTNDEWITITFYLWALSIRYFLCCKTSHPCLPCPACGLEERAELQYWSCWFPSLLSARTLPIFLQSALVGCDANISILGPSLLLTTEHESLVAVLNNNT